MSSFPPPSGRPATMFPRPDPWVEQARRAAEHSARRRRRRLKWIVPAAAALVVVGGAAGWVALTDSTGDAGSDLRSSPPVTSSADAAATTTTPPSTTPPTVASTVAPETLVEVDEVWLIDRGDGRFDWGVAIAVPEGASNRSGVGVDVRLLAGDGTVVDTEATVLDGVSTDSTAVVGVYDAVDVEPVRIEFDVAVGVASQDVGPAGLLEVRAAEIDESNGTVEGRVRSSASFEVVGVDMVLVWRDDEGEIDATTDGRAPIVAVATYGVERIRPGVDARFSIDLAGLDAPPRVPDDILWMQMTDGS